MKTFFKSKTVTVSIRCSPEKVYDFVSNLENLPRWATTFAKSIRQEDGAWVLQTEQGPVKMRMAARNHSGVLDHYVSPLSGEELYIPMRVVRNGAASEVLFTLFQTEDMSDERFARDLELVEKDLGTLRQILEG